MLSGLNTDCRVGGKVYHVQTEDNGPKNPVIITLVYDGGAIIASKKTSYADILKADCLPQVLKTIMEEQHQRMIQELRAGKFTPRQEQEFGADILTGRSLDELVMGYLLEHTPSEAEEEPPSRS